MTDQYAITRLHDLLAAANAEVARLSTLIVARNIGGCVCGDGLGGGRQGSTGGTVDVHQGASSGVGNTLAGDYFGCAGEGGGDKA